MNPNGYGVTKQKNLPKTDKIKCIFYYFLIKEQEN